MCDDNKMTKVDIVSQQDEITYSGDQTKSKISTKPVRIPFIQVSFVTLTVHVVFLIPIFRWIFFFFFEV